MFDNDFGMDPRIFDKPFIGITSTTDYSFQILIFDIGFHRFWVVH